MKKLLKLIIVDDNPFLIKAIADKLSFYDDIRIVFTAHSGTQALSKIASEGKPIDLILMDIEMPEMDGIEATGVIKTKYPQIKILMLTVFDDEVRIFRAIQHGADGYLLKDTAPEDLYQAVVQTMEGGAAMTPSIAKKALNLLRNPLEPSAAGDQRDEVKLSEREVEVLEQIAKGLPYTRIAENLFLSPSTVRKHIENIYQKLQVHSKLDAVQEARSRRLI